MTDAKLSEWHVLERHLMAAFREAWKQARASAKGGPSGGGDDGYTRHESNLIGLVHREHASLRAEVARLTGELEREKRLWFALNRELDTAQAQLAALQIETKALMEAHRADCAQLAEVRAREGRLLQSVLAIIESSGPDYVKAAAAKHVFAAPSAPAEPAPARREAEASAKCLCSDEREALGLAHADYCPLAEPPAPREPGGGPTAICGDCNGFGTYHHENVEQVCGTCNGSGATPTTEGGGR
jgi:hypothetical protein